MSFEIQIEEKLSESPVFVKKAIVQKLTTDNNTEKYFVNIRAFRKVDDKLLPTHNGVCLPFNVFKEILPYLEDCRPFVISERDGQMIEFRNTNPYIYELEYRNKNGKIQELSLKKSEIEKIVHKSDVFLAYDP